MQSESVSTYTRDLSLDTLSRSTKASAGSRQRRSARKLISRIKKEPTFIPSQCTRPLEMAYTYLVAGATHTVSKTTDNAAQI